MIKEKISMPVQGPDVATISGPDGNPIQALLTDGVGFGISITDHGDKVGTMVMTVGEIGIYVPIELDQIASFRQGLDAVEKVLRGEEQLF